MRDRLPEYTESALPLLQKRTLDPRPIYPWLDELSIEWSLSKAREYLGADDPQTKLLLGKESPEALAARLVRGTKLGDPAYRKALWEGGETAIDASTDPMIVYARRIDANARALEQKYDDLVDAPTTAAQAKLADARFAAYGNSIYPDATFTLRISYGKVQGWNERGAAGPDARPLIGGTYERATGADPFDLPPAFIANQGADRQGDDVRLRHDQRHHRRQFGLAGDRPRRQVIGAAFDGNIHSLGGNYGYDPVLNRTVVVSTAAVEEALKNIYPAPALLAELKRRVGSSALLASGGCAASPRRPAPPDLAIALLGLDHVIARDRQRAAVAHILHLVIAGRPALEHDDAAGEIEFPHAEEARVVHLLDLGPRLRRAVEPVAQRVGIMQPQILDVADDHLHLLARPHICDSAGR